MTMTPFDFKHVIPAEGERPEYTATLGFNMEDVDTISTEMLEGKEVLMVYLKTTYDDNVVVPTGHYKTKVDPETKQVRELPPELKYARVSLPKTFKIAFEEDIKAFFKLRGTGTKK